MTLSQEKGDYLVKSIGIDLVKISRIEKNIGRFGNKLSKKILGNKELEILSKRKDKSIFLAGRFAAKEAIIKALGYYLTKRPNWSELEILSSQSGVPQVIFSDNLSCKISGVFCHISITHEKEYAAAVAVITEPA